jgi:putative phosphoesterase
MLGVLSNSDGRAESVTAAVNIFRSSGATFIVHCGDVGGRPILDQLAGHSAAFVWGNTDWDRAGLQEYATDLGLTCLGHGGAIELAGQSLYVTHGDDGGQIRRVLSEQQHDYLLLGHTHSPLDSRDGRVHVINPGALHRAATKTVALLDLDRDVVQFLTVPGV